MNIANPNLAWFIASLCCLVIGFTVHEMLEDDSIQFVVIPLIVIIGVGFLVYCAVSYLML